MSLAMRRDRWATAPGGRRSDPARLLVAGALLLLLAPGTAGATGASGRSLERLQQEAEKAVADGLSAERMEKLAARALDIADATGDPTEAIQALRAAFRITQFRDDDAAAALQQKTVARFAARRFDAGELPETGWEAIWSFLWDALRRPETGEVTASAATYARWYGDLERLGRAAASDRLRAMVLATRADSRAIVDRIYGGLPDRDRAAILSEVEVALARWRELPMTADRTFVEVVTGPLAELRDLHVGAPAPDIDGVDLELAPLRLSDYRGKVVLLSFWASWCPPCVAAIPRERELAARFAGRPFAIVGVDGDEERETGLALARQRGVSWPSFWAYWPGPGGDVPPVPPIKDTWYVRFWPTYYVLDSAGRIRYKSSWDEDLAPIERAIEEILGEVGDDGRLPAGR